MKRILVFGVVFLPVLAGVAVATPPIFDVDRDFYPHYPSLIRYERSAAEFTPPETCGDCHGDQYAEWMGSIHAMAFRDPVYQGELNLAVQAVGNDIARPCVLKVERTPLPEDEEWRLRFERPSTIRLEDYTGREDEGVLFVDHAGEVLHRLERERERNT